MVVLAVVVIAAPVARATNSAPSQAGSSLVVALAATPNPALSDSDNVYLSAHGTHDPGCAITSYAFSFGDGYGTVSTYPHAYHYYHVPSNLSSASFAVTLTVHDKCGNSGTAALTEVVNQDTPPGASLRLSNSSSNPNEIFADASATTDNPQTIPYEFDFYWPDKTETTTYAPVDFASHTFAPSSTTTPRTVTLNVFDYAGTEGVTSQTIGVPTALQSTAPSHVNAVAGNTQATVSWSPPTSGGAPLSYSVTASPGGAAVTVGGAVNQATVTGLSNGTTYSFAVKVTTSGGSATSQPSNPITPIGAPGAPTSVSATEDNASAVVSWSAPTFNEGFSPFSHHQRHTYTVTTFPGGATTVVAGAPAPTNATISGLTDGTAYTFTVTASNGTLSGPTSASSNPVTPAPKGPTITEAPLWKLVEPSTVGTGSGNLPLPITIQWLARPGSAAICSYTLQRSIDNQPWTNVPLPTATSLKVSDIIPASQDRVRYQVQATDCMGTTSSWVQSPEFGYQFYEESSPKFAFVGGWSRTACSSCAGGFDETTTTANATATITLNAAYHMGFIFAVGPAFGSATILQDGLKVATVDTYAPALGYRLLLFKTGWPTFGYHVLQVVNLATAGHPEIGLDGAVVLYAPLARLGL
jgi:Fibronectin type III domain/PKD domain